MNDTSAYLGVGILLIGLAFGLRGSLRLTRRYRAARPLITSQDALLLVGIVAVAWGIVIFALYIGVLSVRRLLGFAPLDWTPLVTAGFATAALFIPTFLDAVVSRVARSIRR